ncbi:MAG: NAD(P)-dependent dehydrogenase (short-subunit alcohol dehydrogenase family) [Parasphingorhabdus sp.]|jgi:NAD(P)-dependent dehydrogenase (short-subunit alcohol dehydrogenase family)
MNNSAKTAVITGAGAGIGRATTLTLLRNGYNVVLTGRREAILQEVIAEAGQNGSSALAVAADVGDKDQVDRIFDRCMETFGRVDVLFNNAGIGAAPVDIDELDVSAWSAVINTNITGSFLCARRAFAEMKKQSPQGGRIINNGSISAHAPRPNSTPYTVSKHAITGLTRCLALDGRRYNIACGQIDIGNAETEMAKPLGEGTAQANGSIMSEPLMDVQHVADSVLNMANLPLESNVLFMTIMATKMPLVGRG